jgi:hypothetical protein
MLKNNPPLLREIENLVREANGLPQLPAIAPELAPVPEEDVLPDDVNEDDE